MCECDLHDRSILLKTHSAVVTFRETRLCSAVKLAKVRSGHPIIFGLLFNRRQRVYP